jgi:hypothetical protein
MMVLLPRLLIGSLLMGLSILALFPVIHPNIKQRFGPSIYVPDTSDCPNLVLQNVEARLDDEESLHVRLIYDSTRRIGNCNVNISLVLNNDTRTAVFVEIGNTSETREVSPTSATHDDIPSFSVMGVPALVRRNYKAALLSSDHEIRYVYYNALQHRSYSKAVLHLAAAFGSKSAPPFDAVLEIPMRYEATRADMEFPLRYRTPEMQRALLRLHPDMQATLFLDDVEKADRRDTFILIFGALFGTGAALVAEALASGVNLLENAKRRKTNSGRAD